MNPHEKALDSIFTDMDDFETKKMFPEDKAKDASGGVDITISVVPKGEGESAPEGSEAPAEFPDANHDEALCKGGCAYHSGGIVEGKEKEVDNSMPPFLRKKKGKMGA